MTPPPSIPTRTSAHPRFLFSSRSRTFCTSTMKRSCVPRATASAPAATAASNVTRRPSSWISLTDTVTASPRSAGPTCSQLTLVPTESSPASRCVEQEIPAGVLDVADDARRGVDAAILAHEIDHPRIVDGDVLRVAESGLQGGLHGSPRRGACGPRGSYPSRARRSSGWESWCSPR